MVGQELELRFAADEASVAKIRRSAQLKARTVGPVRTRKVVTTYHDTPDDKLFAAGIAWQVKRHGRAWMQTVTPINGAGAIRVGAEAPIKSAEPDRSAVFDPTVSGALKDVLGNDSIGPRVETHVQRTERRIVTERGDIVELALDTADVTAGDNKDRAFEVDFALKAGAPSSLFEIARPFAEDLPLELCLITSAERGFRLLEGKPPGKAPWIKLPREASAAEALSAIITSSLRHIALHAKEARCTERSEAVHQIRVGLRRLRSALQDYGRVFDSDELRSLSQRARDLAGILSPARDLDVFISDILDPVRDSISFVDAFQEIEIQAKERRAQSWASAKQALDGPSYRVFLVDAAGIAMCGISGTTRDVPPAAALLGRTFAAEVLDRRLDRARSLGARLDELANEERHELRKELKKLRYPAEFFASLFESKGAKKFFSALTDLQDDLGGLNDVATARQILEEVVDAAAAKEPRHASRIAMTAGEIIGWHSHRADKALKRVAKHWSKFEDATPFWHKG